MNNPRIDMLWKTVGKRCRERRTELGVTQLDLSEAIKMDRTSIVNLEAGKQRLPLTRLVILARALDTEAATLIEGY